MRIHILIFFTFSFFFGAIHAQTATTLQAVQQVSLADLMMCDDTSSFHGSVVSFDAIVVMDGGLAYSLGGRSLFVQDGTGPFSGLNVRMLAPSMFADLLTMKAGDSAQFIGTVENFGNETQLEVSFIFPRGINKPISSTLINLSDLNNSLQVNQLTTGEQWEGVFVELQNLRVVQVDSFGTPRRYSFIVADMMGNRMHVGDRFPAQRGSGYGGTFSPPNVGDYFTSLKGVIAHSANGCLGGTGRGYELFPFDTSHYQYGAPPLNTYTICNQSQSSDASGILYDSGGPTGSYANSQFCGFLIDPGCADSIQLTFRSFSLESSYDYLRVYDGANTSAPLLLSRTGFGVPPDVTAYSGQMYVLFTSDGSVTYSGFDAIWQAYIPAGAAPLAGFALSSPNPPLAAPVQFTDQSTGNVTQWKWDFGDGDTAVVQHPTHTYMASGMYTVTLIVTTCNGDADTTQQSLTVQGPAQMQYHPTSFSDTLTTCGDSVSFPLAISNTGSGNLTYTLQSQPREYSPIIISEASLYTSNALELTNISGGSVDVSGWRVLASNSYTNINAFNSTTWNLTGTMQPREVQYRWDFSGQYYWGTGLLWGYGNPGWAMLIDDTGQVRDVLVWGWTATSISQMQITYNGQTLRLDDGWQGNGFNYFCTTSIVRNGSTDLNRASDFSCTTASLGSINPSLQLPFANSTPSMIRFQPSGGTVLGGDSSSVNVTFRTTDLLPGVYTGQFVIYSNDTSQSSVLIPYTFNFPGTPAIALDPGCWEMDSVDQYSSIIKSFWVYNTGCDTLSVSQTYGTGLYFDVQPTAHAILPNDSAFFTVVFSPDTVGLFQDSFTLFNNDHDTTICLTGYGTGVPEIHVVPDSIHVLFTTCDDSLKLPLYITNQGRDSLHYQVVSSGVANTILHEDFESGNFNNWTLAGGSYTRQVTTSDPGGGIYSFQQTGGNSSHYNGVYQDFPSSQPSYVSFRVKSASTLAADAYFVLGDRNNFGDGIAFFFARNNGQMGIYISTSNNSTVSYVANTWYHIEYRNIDFVTKTFDFYVDGQLISQGFPFRQQSNFVNRIHLYNYHNSTATYDDIIISDQVVAGTNWIAAVPDSGVVAVGSTDSLAICISAHGLNNGVYNSQVTIQSDDPLMPTLNIPVVVEVLGDPGIAFLDSCLVMDSTRERSASSAILSIINPGCDTLSIDSSSFQSVYFGAFSGAFNISPRDTFSLLVQFSPDSVGNFMDSLRLWGNFGDTSLLVKGVGTGSPTLAYQPDSIQVTFADCGDSAAIPVTIYNTGNAKLILQTSLTGGQNSSDTIRVLALTYGVDLSREYPNTLAAIGQYFSRYKLDAINTTDSTTLRQALIGKEVLLLPENESGANFVFANLGRVMRDFARNGGSIIACGEIGFDNIFNANLFSGIYQGGLSSGQTLIVDPSHPGFDQISSLSVHDGTFYMTCTNPDYIPLLRTSLISNIRYDISGYRNFGDGRVIFLGYDFWNYGNDLSRYIGNLVNWAGSLSLEANWLRTVPDSLCIGPGDSAVMMVHVNSQGLVSGTYYASIALNNNTPDSAAAFIPVQMNVLGGPQLTLPSPCIQVDTTRQFTALQDSFWLNNIGCVQLTVDSMRFADTVFSLVSYPITISPFDSALVHFSFNPDSVKLYTDSLHIWTNAQDTALCVQGVGSGSPIIRIAPDSLSVTLSGCGDTLCIPVTVYNDGLANLDFMVEQSGGMLEDVLIALNQNFGQINSLIPNRFNFSGGVLGTSISDGGSDMYDTGNILNTNLGFSIPYSDNLVQNNARFGPAGRYFTRKYPGLFVLGADIDGVYSFEITGNLGADGSGAVDGTELVTTVQGKTYRGFVKRVYNAGDPSVNQLIIVEDRPGLAHNFSANSDNNQHEVTGLANSTRVYYLLYARTSGGYINNTSTLQIMRAFLQSIPQSTLASWAEVMPDSAMVAPGDSLAVNICLDAQGLKSGIYQSIVEFITNDPRQGIAQVPVQLEIIGTPQIQLPSTCYISDTTRQYSTTTDTLWIYNTGCDTLEIADITRSTPYFSLNTTSVNILPFDSTFLLVSFSPDTVGLYQDTLQILNNDRDTVLCLQGYGTGVPCVRIDPDTVIAIIPGCDSTLTLPLTIYNEGLDSLLYSISLPNYDSTSFRAFSTSGAQTIHTFSGISPGLDTMILTVTLNGDFDQSGEYADIYIDGSFFQRISPFSSSSSRQFVLSGAMLQGWLTDGQIQVRVQNSPGVGAFFANNSHRIRLHSSHNSSWFSFTPTQGGTVSVGDSTQLSLNFAATGLTAGYYQTTLILQTNDPRQPIVSVPVSMRIIGQELITLSDTAMDFDSVFVGYTRTMPLTLANLLCDTLAVSSITSNDPAFTVNQSNFIILPFDSVQINVTFSPLLKTTYTGQLTILNSGQDTTVNLRGTGIGIPIVGTIPDSVNASLDACADSAFIPLSITNTGDGLLKWQIDANIQLTDDFEQGVNFNNLWSTISLGTIDNRCGTYQGTGALYFNGSGSRRAESRDMVTTGGGLIEFALRIGTGSFGGCENADFGEEIVLEYSINGGASWQIMETFGVNNYPTFSLVQRAIPLAAQTPSTRFRWRQISNSGFGYDNWAIDAVSISTNASNNLQVTVTPDSGCTAAMGNTSVVVKIVTSQLSNGQYPILLNISSNDPLTPNYLVPGLLTITGQPVISLAQPSPATICDGDSILLTSDSTQNISWSTGAITPSIWARNTGSYSVTLTKPSGCQITSAPVNIIKNAPILTNIQKTGPNCSGSVLDLSVSGGTAPYQYSWNTGATSQDLTLSIPGFYQVTVTDGVGCSVTDSLNVTNLAVVALSTSKTDVFCLGAATGAIDLTVTGGQAPFTYFWTNGDTTEDLTNLTSGTYAVTVIDAAGCSNSTTVTINPGTSISLFATSSSVSCAGGSDGAINLTASGIHMPFTYSWSNGATTQDISGLSAGRYTVTVVNAVGCNESASFFVNEPLPISLSAVVTDTCGTGDIDLSVGGGTPFYQYQWSNGATSQDVSGLSLGLYTVTVTDFKGCQDSLQVYANVRPLPGMPFVSIGGNDTICQGDSVLLTATMTQGGLLWSTGAASPSIWAGSSGNYTVTVMDTFGCTNTSLPIAITALPKVGIQATGPTTICFGQTITLTAGPGSSFLWSTGQTGASITPFPFVDTDYVVTATNSFGCVSSDTLRVMVIPPVAPGAVSNMLPVDSANAVALPLVLSWAPGTNATSYDLYFWPDSASPPANPTVSGITGISYAYSGNLSYGVTYKWQLVSKNNCFITPGPVQQFTVRELPDLVALNVQGPANALSGQQIVVTWQVDNIGSGPTGSSLWLDRVYLSRDAVLGLGDINVGAATNFSALQVGGSYTNTLTFSLPDCIWGDYYVFVAADHGRNILEGNEQNNVDSTATPIMVQISPKPDLQVDSVQASPAFAFAGDLVTVVWQVTNYGTSATRAQSWHDRLYLTQDTVFSVANSILVGTFSHVGILDTTLAGRSYLQTTQFNLPPFADSSWYVFVETDVYNNVNECAFGNLNEQNNRKRSNVIQVTAIPPADLVATVLSCIDTASNSQTVNLTWRVDNLGLDTTNVQQWQDQIYLTTRPDSNLSQAIYLGAINHTGALGPGGSYQQTAQVTIPSRISGAYYFYIKTDANNRVYEGISGENNNVARCAQQTHLIQPDLVVSQVTLPAVDSTGLPFQVSWIVKNQGIGDKGIGGLRDNYYLSTDPILDPSDFFLGAKFWSSSLAQGDSILHTASPQIPPGFQGSYYLIVFTDYFNNIFEGVNENNNIGASTFPIDIRRPDLIVRTVSVPAQAVTGQQLSIQWTLENQGMVGIPPSSWIERITLSTSPLYHASTGIQISQATLSASMGMGDTLARMTTVPLPFLPPDTYYVHVFTDYLDDIDEGLGENNNTQVSGPVDIILAPYPDLQITSMNYLGTDTVEGGDFVDVAFTVINRGTGPAQGVAWLDKIYLSPDTLGQTLIPLNQVSRSSTLEVDSSYTIQTRITIPYGLSGGHYYFCARTDDPNRVYEYIFENNNIRKSDSIYVKPYPPIDLRLDQAQSVATAMSGTLVPITWGVTHLGDTITAANFWFDGVYLSTDTLLDAADRFLDDWTVFGPINSSTSYLRSEQVRLPNGISGTYYLLMVADHLDLNPDADRSNNVLSIPLQITLTPPPDLAASRFSIPPQGTAGQPIMASWEVDNTGSGPANSSWFDEVYLSTDFVLDPGDTYLGGNLHNTTLASGQSYTDSSQVFLPVSAGGNYILLFKTDARNQVFENGLEQNNLRSMPIIITQPPPADLIVHSIVQPDSAVIGDTVCFDYIVENIGQNPANGYSRTAIFLSRDGLWDVNDVLVSDQSMTLSLPPQLALSQQVCAEIPGVSLGYHRVIVRVDLHNNIFESDDGNNDGTSIDSIYIDVPELLIGLPVTPDILVDNKGLYYRIEVPTNLAGETMRVTLDGSSPHGINQLYLRDGDIPSRTVYDYGPLTLLQTKQEVIIPSLQPGTYYLMGYGEDTIGTSQNITLLAEILPFEIIQVTANRGGNTGGVTVKIEGGKFELGMTPYLKHDSLGIIPGVIVQYVNPSTVFASFNLFNASIGLYDVKLEKMNGDTAILARGFEVVAGPAGGTGPLVGNGSCVIPASLVGQALVVNIQHPRATRPNRIASMIIEYENTGLIDLPVPTRFVLSLDGTPIAFQVPDLARQDTRLYVELTEPNGPPNVLRPGARGAILIYTKATVVNSMGFRLVE